MEDILPIIFTLLFVAFPALFGHKKKQKTIRKGNTPRQVTTEDILRELLGDDYQKPITIDTELPPQSSPENPYSNITFIESESESNQPARDVVLEPKMEEKRVVVSENIESNPLVQCSADSKNEKLNVDPKKMILYSELLKPKFTEY